MSKAYLAAREKFNAVLNDPTRNDRYCRTNRHAAGKEVGNELINHARLPPQRRRSSAASTDFAKMSFTDRLAFTQMARRRSSAASTTSMTENTRTEIQNVLKNLPE